MRQWPGAFLAIAACLTFLVLLAGPYAVQSADAVATYYDSGVLNPLVAGLFAVGVVLAFVAAAVTPRWRDAGIGIALGLAAGALLVAVVWAATARVDVFAAPGWLIPSQRFVLVGLAGTAVLGAGWYARANGITPVGG